MSCVEGETEAVQTLSGAGKVGIKWGPSGDGAALPRLPEGPCSGALDLPDLDDAVTIDKQFKIMCTVALEGEVSVTGVPPCSTPWLLSLRILIAAASCLA